MTEGQATAPTPPCQGPVVCLHCASAGLRDLLMAYLKSAAFEPRPYADADTNGHLALIASHPLCEIESVERLAQRCPIVWWADTLHPRAAGMARAIGCQGFVLRDSPLSELTRVLREAAQGRFATCALAEQRHCEPDPLEALSPRETDVLRCWARGMRRQEIGHELSLKPQTISENFKRIQKKLLCPDDIALAKLMAARDWML